MPVLPLFIPPLSLPDAWIDFALVSTLITLLGILLIREALRSLAAGMGAERLNSALICILILMASLLIIRLYVFVAG